MILIFGIYSEMGVCLAAPAPMPSNTWKQLEQIVTGVPRVYSNPIGRLPAALDIELHHGWQLCFGELISDSLYPLIQRVLAPPLICPDRAVMLLSCQ